MRVAEMVRNWIACVVLHAGRLLRSVVLVVVVGGRLGEVVLRDDEGRVLVCDVDEARERVGAFLEEIVASVESLWRWDLRGFQCAELGWRVARELDLAVAG